MEAGLEAPVTLNALRKMKEEGRKITCVTAYDASFAGVVDEAGIDLVLVGDSLGMVVQGHKTTIPVTLEDMIYHGSMVARGLKRSFLVLDMPFMSYASPEDALRNATLLMKKASAHMVKLEWGQLQLGMVRRLNECGIPICAHLGLRPQQVHKTGGYRVQGRDPETASKLLEDARALEEAGADILLLECVPSKLAAEIAKKARIPVIGIGAGVDVDGQILVLYDILDIAPGKRARFSKNYISGSRSIQEAVKRYIEEVQSGAFPAEEHSFSS